MTEHTASEVASRVRAFLLRLMSITAGVFIEYRQVFHDKSAQWILVFLGLWLMSVPPALWLDSLRRITQGAASVTAGGPGVAPSPESEIAEDKKPPPKVGL